MLVSYLRISMAEGSQVLDLQWDALIAAGVKTERLYEDQASGKRDGRLGMEACLKTPRHAFAAALQAGLATRERANLSRWGEWLGITAQLALLHSRCCRGMPQGRSAREEAEALRRRMLDRDDTTSGGVTRGARGRDERRARNAGGQRAGPLIRLSATARQHVRELTAHYRKSRRPEAIRNLITAVEVARQRL